MPSGGVQSIEVNPGYTESGQHASGTDADEVIFEISQVFPKSLARLVALETARVVGLAIASS